MGACDRVKQAGKGYGLLACHMIQQGFNFGVFFQDGESCTRTGCWAPAVCCARGTSFVVWLCLNNNPCLRQGPERDLGIWQWLFPGW